MAREADRGANKKIEMFLGSLELSQALGLVSQNFSQHHLFAFCEVWSIPLVMCKLATGTSVQRVWHPRAIFRFTPLF